MRHSFERLSHAAAMVFIVLQCVDAAAADTENVEVQKALTTVVSSFAEMRERCPNVGRYDACTMMIAYRLTAHCTPSAAGWTLDAAATFRPWIFLDNVKSLAHELEHVRDIRLSVERHVAGLEGMVFASGDACQAQALIASTSFAANLSGFALESNLRRHPQLRQIARK